MGDEEDKDLRLEEGVSEERVIGQELWGSFCDYLNRIYSGMNVKEHRPDDWKLDDVYLYTGRNYTNLYFFVVTSRSEEMKEVVELSREEYYKLKEPNSVCLLYTPYAQNKLSYIQ